MAAKKPTLAAKQKITPARKQKDARTIVLADALPRRPLEESLKVAQIIRDTYAGKAATWEEIAKAKGVSATNPVNRYPLWSAVAYGIILKNDDNTYSLSETGRKTLAPTYEGGEKRASRKHCLHRRFSVAFTRITTGRPFQRMSYFRMSWRRDTASLVKGRRRLLSFSALMRFAAHGARVKTARKS